MKISTKLNIGFLIACFLPLTAVTLHSMYYYNAKIHQEAENRISSDLKAAELIYQAELDNLRNLAIYHASVPSLQLLLKYKLEPQLEKQLVTFSQRNDLSSVTVITPKFERFPKHADLYEIYALWALSEKVSSGTERSTPQGTLMLVAAAPIYDKEGGFIGATVLTRRFLGAGILDEIRRQTGANSYSITHSDSDREREPVKVFYKAPKALAKTIEITNTQGVPIGSLVVWRGTEEYDKTRHTAILVFLLIGIGGVVLAALLRYLITRTIVRPIYILQKAADHIEAGNFSTRVGLSGYDEIGKLGQHFNSMAEKIEKSFVHQKAEIAAKNAELQMKNKELMLALNQLDAIQGIIESRAAFSENTAQEHPKKALPKGTIEITADSASEFKNSLYFICSFTQILIDFVDDLKTELAQEHPRQEALEHIFKELPNLARTIHQQGCYAGQLLRRLLGVKGRNVSGNGDHDLTFTVMLPASHETPSNEALSDHKSPKNTIL